MTRNVSPLARREYSQAEAERAVTRHRSWSAWGAADELGHGNLITAQRRRQAAGLVRRGESFSLAIPLDRSGPQSGRTARVNPQHLMLKHGGDILATGGSALRGSATTDDAIYMPLQAATQWDSFAHFFYDGLSYNGQSPHIVTSEGATRNSIAMFSDRLVTRGVLLDIAGHLGLDSLPAGAAIQAEDLERCADAQGVEVRSGDVVLVRTGQMARCRGADGWVDFVGHSTPGLGLSAADFLCPRGVAGVASDTWALETIPFECQEMRYPLHVALLVNAGVLIGEMWDLEALAADCRQDGIYEFLLCAVPLPITGAVGSPVNPIAVK